MKSLVVDEEQTIVSGYNVNNWYEGGNHDAGVHVSGPVGSTSMSIFAENWKKNSSGSGLCEPGVDDLLTITDIVNQCHEYMPSLDSFAENKFAPSIKSIELLNENHFVFPLYRNDNFKESDNAIITGIEAAVSTVNIWQQRFTSDSLGIGSPLPFVYAIENAIEHNDSSGNSDFRINLLLGNDSNTRFANRIGVAAMRSILGENLWEYFQVRLASDGVHTKALSIDNEFLIVGSQNWDISAWGDGGVDLHEYSFGIDNAQLTAEFDDEFVANWSTAQTPCEIYPDQDWWPLFLDCGNAPESKLADNSGKVSPPTPTIWLDEGIYMGSNLDIDHPVTVVGLGAGTILEPNPAIFAKTSEPIIRITSSNVTLTGLHFRNSSGYAIEIGDGITPIENVFIGRSIFENNGLGGIKINGAADIHYIQNNTFAGGEAGIVINVSGASDSNAIVQDNIFSGQTVMPIIVESAHDGGITYSYNLFDNCSRAVGGVCPYTWVAGSLHVNSSYDHNLINTPVIFTDANNSDYSLSYPSSAIDAAKPIDSTDDYAGFYFDGDGDRSIRPDIGAIEFSRGGTLLPAPRLDSPQLGETIPDFPVDMRFGGPEGVEVQIQIATDGQFLNVVADIRSIFKYTWSPKGGELGTYYWKGKMVGCCNNEWSPVRQFIVGYPSSTPPPLPTSTPTPLPPTSTPTPLPPTSTPTPAPPSCILTPPVPANPFGVDLLVTNVSISPANPVIGNHVVVIVTIKNQGQSNIEWGNNAWLDFYVNPNPEPPIENQVGNLSWGIQATDLPAGASHTYSAIYIVTSSGDMRIWAQVDTDNTITESNENNNTYGCLGITVSGNGSFTEELVETPTPVLTTPRVTPTPVFQEVEPLIENLNDVWRYSK